MQSFKSTRNGLTKAKAKDSSGGGGGGCQPDYDPLDDTIRAGQPSSAEASVVQRHSHHASTADDAAALREANAKNLRVIEDAVSTLAGLKRLERASRLAGTREEGSNTAASISSNQPGGLRSSVSMIELRELADIRAFDDAMQAIAHASSAPATATATATNINNNSDNVANDNASANVIVANEDNITTANDDDEHAGGFFIGDTEDDDSQVFGTSYIIEEKKISLNDVADGDDDHHHHVFSPLKRMHSLPADPNACSISGCSTTTTRQSSFLPSCASICEGDEKQAARRNSAEHNHTVIANDATCATTTADNNKAKRSSFPTKIIKKSVSLLSLNSLGGRSNDGDDEEADDSVGRSNNRNSRRGSFTKRSLKKSTSTASLRGSRKTKNEEDELACSLGSSLHSFSSRHDPLARPTKSAMKRSVSMCALELGNASNRTLGTYDSSSSENPDVPMKRNVSFHTMEIREYGVILGDNPSCSSGPPVQLAWDPHDSTELKIDDYEEYRPPRRDRAEMLMSYNVRWWSLMRESGYTVSQLKRATDACQEARKARLETVRKVRRQEKISNTLTAPMRSLKKLTAS